MRLRLSSSSAGNALALPAAALVAIVLHLAISSERPTSEVRLYAYFLCMVLLAGFMAAALQFVWVPLRNRVSQMSPIFAAGILLLAVWEIITTGLHWLPLPYFPGPAAVLQSMTNDYKLLFESTWNSLILLLGGYVLGVTIALITGVCIGWFAPARYWGMPLLKVVGPIPATAWIPLAMVVSPSARLSAVGLIALAVWFPDNANRFRHRQHAH